MKCNGHLPSQYTIDYHGVCSDTGIPGTILCMWIRQLLQKVKKQVEAKIENLMDQRTTVHREQVFSFSTTSINV